VSESNLTLSVRYKTGSELLDEILFYQ